ncbi:histone-like nucleoid-structuring protein Lsr2 [Kribbella sp. VKM Ac-2566]|uniref:Lsr2 family DNA-binding protein n=1 Tax=Kribbella sp. VKM Ac-2566 TaxID=2512218 RepID=UPI001EE0A4DD|nr:histone-like nucleoid-structuring protein Lsr2 [Kribbella sp. VKM Ac-2566]
MKNGRALRNVLQPYVAAGGPSKNTRGVRTQRTRVGADAKTVKEWARANGYEVNDRGRIPNEIRQAFERAN